MGCKEGDGRNCIIIIHRMHTIFFVLDGSNKGVYLASEMALSIIQRDINYCEDQIRFGRKRKSFLRGEVSLSQVG